MLTSDKTIYFVSKAWCVKFCLKPLCDILLTSFVGATALSHPPFFIADYERSLCKMKEIGIHFNF